MKIARINVNPNFTNKKLDKTKITSYTKGKKVKIKDEKEKISIKMNLIRLWRIVPFFIKLMSLTTLILYLLNLFFINISFYLSNIPLYTIYHFQFWRLFSSFLITTNIYNAILGLIFWTREGSSMETRMGTIKYIIYFLRNNFFIQILYTLVISLFSLIIRNKKSLEQKIKYEYGNIQSVNNCGFWPGIMCELTLLCISNPNTKVKFLFFPFQFSAKYYPFIWLFFFCLVNTINFYNDIEVLVGMYYALIYHKFLKNILNISDGFILKIEKNICCNCFFGITGFISVNKFNSKFDEEKTNQRMNIQVLRLNNKINRKNLNKSNDDIERDIKISSEYTNRSDNSMIQIITPSKSIFDKSFTKTKILN